jgi:glycosyltransferase involved in cell wall biosynthesis
MISIIVPAHNEEGNLPRLVEELLPLARRMKNTEIVLVDDNSKDRTPSLCDKYAKQYNEVRTIHRKGRKGMGFTLQEGTLAASGDIIIWTMADLSDDLNAIPKFVKKIQNGADMVFGSRYMQGGNPGDLSFLKKTASKGFVMLSRILIGIKVHDITNAFRGFRKEVFNSIPLVSGDFAISPEFSLKAHRNGYKLGEVPTDYTDRREGVAQFKFFKMGRRYFKIFLKASFRVW